MSVWKFVVYDETGLRDVVMPDGAQVLSVHEQGDTVCIWALVDPNAPSTKRRFLVHGTGHPVSPEAGPYVGTTHLYGGDIVLHIFEMKP